MTNPLSFLHDQIEQWKQEGTYQRLRVLESESAAESRFDGKQVINLASNNYLGLTTHPKLREAALEAVRKFGVGSGAVRTISGTMSLHMAVSYTHLDVYKRQTLPFTWTLSCTKSPTHFPFKRWYSRILRSGYQPECRIHRPR